MHRVHLFLGCSIAYFFGVSWTAPTRADEAVATKPHAAVDAVPRSPSSADEKRERARSADDVWSARTIAISAAFGFASPLGNYGVEGEWSPAPWLNLAVGVGNRPQNGSHVQIAVMPRVRLVLNDAVALSFGAGASMGGYEYRGYAG